MSVETVQETKDQAELRELRRYWTAITALLIAGIFVQAAFAGAMLSGVEWARVAHAVTATALIATTTLAGVVSLLALRRVPNGRHLAMSLGILAAGLFLQTAVGKMVARGDNLMWAHVPVGVALVGLAGRAAAFARRLGG